MTNEYQKCIDWLKYLLFKRQFWAIEFLNSNVSICLQQQTNNSLWGRLQLFCLFGSFLKRIGMSTDTTKYSLDISRYLVWLRMVASTWSLSSIILVHGCLPPSTSFRFQFVLPRSLKYPPPQSCQNYRHHTLRWFCLHVAGCGWPTSSRSGGTTTVLVKNNFLSIKKQFFNTIIVPAVPAGTYISEVYYDISYCNNDMICAKSSWITIILQPW